MDSIELSINEAEINTKSSNKELKINNDELYNLLQEEDSNVSYNIDDFMIANELNYSTNYTAKMLHQICNYYKICIRKKKKQDLIEELVAFESDPENFFIFNKRKELWNCWKKLSEDDFFKTKLLHTYE